MSPPYQLPDHDGVFLAMETPNTTGHVGSLCVLDPGSCPDFGHERLAAHVAGRLHLVPRFTWKLEPAPLGLDQPYWVESPDFEPRDHVKRMAVPSPGGLRELTELASYLHAQPLDRSRPLWEVWLIEGLADGRVALYMKMHHCLMDGAAGVGLGEVLADLTPDAEAPLVPPVFLEQMPGAPSALTLAWNALRNARGRRRRLAFHVTRGLRQLTRELVASDSEPRGPVPRLFFNQAPGRRRALATTSLPLQRVKDLAKHFDVKINDVVLEIVGSAMRRYLDERGELPDESLVALCPVSTRDARDQRLENQITSMSVPLATEDSDPTERVRRIHAAAGAAKQGVAEGSFDIMAALGESFSPAVAQLLMKASEIAGDRGPLPGNFVVSNVRATPMPVYLAGARVDSLMPMSLLSVGQALNVTVVSYCGRLDVGIIVDPDLVGDVWDLADAFPKALEELEAAARELVRRAG